MKLIYTLLIVFLLAAVPQPASLQSTPPSGITQLYIQLDPDNLTGEGHIYSFTLADSVVTAKQAQDRDGDGLVDYVHIGFGNAGHHSSLVFATTQLHTEIKPGFYDKAMTATFEPLGHPGLDLIVDNYLCNTLTGKFTVLQAVFDYSSENAQLISFAAQFEQLCDGAPYPATGIVYYNYTPTSSLRFYPGTVNGGASSKGIVELANPAPAGGAVVGLTSTNTALANVPGSVTVPEGDKTGTFSITTGIVKSPTSVAVFASYNGVTDAAVLKVVSPIPSLTQLHLHGDPGDFLVGPHDYLLTRRDGFIRAAAANGPNGQVNYFFFSFNDFPFDHEWELSLTTRNLNTNLVPGYYPDAQSYGEETAGHPGLRLSNELGWCSPITGEFTVTDAEFDYSSFPFPLVSSFAADFVEHCNGNPPAATGTVYYNYTPPSLCVLSISPFSASFSADPGTGSFNVTQASNCNWTASSNVPWITVTSGAGAGNGAVSYSVTANTGTGNRTGTITISGSTFTIVQGKDFLDVPKTHLFYTEIGQLSARGITVGCTNGTYCPEDPVTRQQMAAFIIRALGEFHPVPAALQRFADVPLQNPFSAFIDRLAAFGITSGCAVNNQGQPSYCPADNVTREQMAAFIIRALGEYDPPVPSSQRYLDVPASNPFYAFIDRLGALGITRGCGGGNYCPHDNVTRGQMAAFLVRAFGL